MWLSSYKDLHFVDIQCGDPCPCLGRGLIVKTCPGSSRVKSCPSIAGKFAQWVNWEISLGLKPVCSLKLNFICQICITGSWEITEEVFSKTFKKKTQTKVLSCSQLSCTKPLLGQICPFFLAWHRYLLLSIYFYFHSSSFHFHLF